MSEFDRGFERMPRGLEQLFQQLQEWVINDIARRILKTDGFTSTAEYMLTRATEIGFTDGLQQQIQRVLNISDAEIKSLYEKAATSHGIYDKRVFQGRIPFTPYKENKFLQRMVENFAKQTNGELFNFTRSLGFAENTSGRVQFKPIAQYYQQELDMAMMKVYTGEDTMQNAIKTAVTKMSNSGLRTVDYATGWSNRIDVAVRRAVMSGLSDLTNMQSEHNAQILGTTVYEISWHNGHRPSHGWGGRRFDTTGKYYPTEHELYAEYGGGTLDDYNCYHIKYATFHNVPPNYTDDELKALEENELKTHTFEGKEYTAYEARQQQRKFERAMRIQRSKIAGLKAAGDTAADDLIAAKAKYTRQRQVYKDFSKAMGLRPEYQRVYTGFDGEKSDINSSNKTSGSKWTGGGRTPEEIGRAAAKIPKRGVTTTEINISGDDEKVFTIPEKRGIIGDTDGNTTITDIRPIDWNNEDEINREINNFIEKYAYADVEHALVISPTNQIYELKGISFNVNSELAGMEILRGSRVIHNHPIAYKDSFSRSDFMAFFKGRHYQSEIISGDLYNIMRYTGSSITPAEAHDLYINAFSEIRAIAEETDIPIEIEQLEIMRHLSKTLKGLIFVE